MNDSPKAGNGLSVLALEFEVLDERPDWPVLTIRVDGKSPFATVAKNWRGFDPDKILGPNSPLVPDDSGHRVAVYRCVCGEAGCGVIAPFVVASPDRKRVSWVDFRDYVGVFVGPVTRDVEDFEGKPWNLPEIHFDRDQYLAEVERASNDRSWETPRRRTARLLHERLRPMGLLLPPNLTLAWVTPAWVEEGAALMFQSMTRDPEYNIQQQLLRLTSKHADPARAADDMAEQLLSVRPEKWASIFGHDLG
jgi:hypothetical protein